MTQSTASRHLKRLEESVGEMLLDRSEVPLRPTAAGRQLLQFAGDTLDRWAVLRQELESEPALAGPLRIAASSAPALGPVSEWLAEFVSRYPRVRPRLSVLGSHAVEAALLRHHAAIGFMGCPPADCCLDARAVATDRIRLAVPAALAGELTAPLDPAMLAELPIVAREDGSGTWQTVNEALAAQGWTLPAEPVLVVDSADGALAAVRSGIGATFASAASLERERGTQVTVMDVAGVNLDRWLYLVCEPETLWRDPIAHRFRQMVLARADALLPAELDTAADRRP